MKFTVTRELISQGCRSDSGNCPVGLAIVAAFRWSALRERG